MSQSDLALHLFLQLAVILATCRVVGWVGRYFGQTQVVSEMVAGVLLGPSLFGWIAPGVQEWLFPREQVVVVAEAAVTAVHPSMTVLYALSQLGLVLYMFLVGLEFELERIGPRLRSASLVAVAGFVSPFVLGAFLAVGLHGREDLFRPGLSALGASLFLGAALSITAFPMLARILYERRLTRTQLGTVALAAGSINDAIAWCLLAVVLATVHASPAIALWAVGGAIVFGLVMVLGGRRVLRRIIPGEGNGALTVSSFTLVLLVVMLSATFTEAIGLYSVFGAFVAGAVMPRGRITELIRRRTELLTTSLLLPVFFVYSGLNTSLGLVNRADLWLITGAVMITAILGKGAGCAVAARMGGETWRDAVAVGTLMNARGLMELILLNIGLEAGLITPTLFTILVLMAVVTTLMASPLFHWIYGRHAAQAQREAVSPWPEPVQ